MNKCINCNKDAKNKFCSRSCSSAYNNQHRFIRKEVLKRINIKKHCEKCGLEFEVTRVVHKDGKQSVSKKERKFCSRSCANSRILNEETKRKISVSLKDRLSEKNKKIYCKDCGKEICHRSKTGYCNKCYPKIKAKDKEYRKKLSKSIQKNVQDGSHVGWKSRNITSYPEKFFIRVLKNNNLFDKCKVNYPIKKRELGLHCSASYFLDFFFEEKRIDLEIDGKQHEYEDRKKSDKVRDNALIENNFNVYRIKWKNPVNDDNKTYIKNEIEKFLDYYNSH